MGGQHRSENLDKMFRLAIVTHVWINFEALDGDNNRVVPTRTGPQN